MSSDFFVTYVPDRSQDEEHEQRDRDQCVALEIGLDETVNGQNERGDQHHVGDGDGPGQRAQIDNARMIRAKLLWTDSVWAASQSN